MWNINDTAHGFINDYIAVHNAISLCDFYAIFFSLRDFSQESASRFFVCDTAQKFVDLRVKLVLKGANYRGKSS